ncbi:ferritin family protein [Gemmatimonadota bacterium]
MLEELTLRKAVEFAVTTEQLGAKFYNKMAKKFEDDEEIKEIFTTLAKDELIHEKQFQNLLNSVPKDPDVSSQDDRWAILRVLSMSEFFMGESGLFKKLEEIETREDALQRAFNLEKDALAYYRAMEDIIGKDDTLASIIQAERQHLLKVMEYMLTEAKMRGLADQIPGSS